MKYNTHSNGNVFERNSEISMSNMELLLIKSLFYLRKTVKYIKMFKIGGTSCYDINVTCIQRPQDDLLKSVKFEFSVSFRFLLHLKKKMVKLSVKAR